MALLQSILIPLGSQMPAFTLNDAQGNTYEGASSYGDRGLLIGFFCNHCPYAQAVWPRFIRIGQYAASVGIKTLAINPNINPDYPEDAPERMLEKIKQWGIPFPYLVDETQEVARAFKAQCTPDIFLFNENKKLIYHGRIDDNWQDESKVTHQELKKAINCYVTGEPIPSEQKPCMGCSIKWR